MESQVMGADLCGVRCVHTEDVAGVRALLATDDTYSFSDNV